MTLKNKSKSNLTIEKLAALSLDQKVFQFNMVELEVGYDELVSKGVLKEKGVLVVIVPSLEFSRTLFFLTSSKLGLNAEKGMIHSLEFVQQVEEYYRSSEKAVIGITQHMSSLFKYLLVEGNIEFESVLEEIIPFFEREKNLNFIRQFNAVFFESLPLLNISTKVIIQIADFVIPKIKTNTEINTSINLLTKAIESLCSDDEKRADEFINTFLTKTSPSQLVFAAAIAGKYHSSKFEINFLKKLAKEEKNHSPIIAAISALKIDSEIQGSALVDFVESLNLQEERLLIDVPIFFARLIVNKNLAGSNLINRSFYALKSLINNPSINVKQSSLRSLLIIDGFDLEVGDLLTSLGTDITRKEFGFLIANILSSRKSPKYFFDVVKAYSIFGKSFPVDLFEYPISHFLNEAANDFSTGVIELLIHDEGSIRLSGSKIIKSASNVYGNFTFAVDLLTLPPLDQYKLWVSVLHSDFDIERALPAVISIRKSQSQFVAEVFKLKLEYEIENYGSIIIEILEDHADPNDTDDNELLARLKLKNEHVIEKLKLKSAISEFNPYLTQSKLINSFNNTWGAKFNNSIQKSVDKGSILRQMATTIILAKGGGWKHEDEATDKIGKLAKIETGLVLPRQHTISPNKYDYEIKAWYIEDWTKQFKRWEAII